MKHHTNRRGMRRYVIDTPDGQTRAVYARSVAELPASAGIHTVDREPRTAAAMSDSARYYRAEDRAIIRRLRDANGNTAGTWEVAE